MEYYLFSEKQNDIVAIGEAVIVCVDQIEMKKTAIPEDIKVSINHLESQVNNDLT